MEAVGARVHELLLDVVEKAATWQRIETEEPGDLTREEAFAYEELIQSTLVFANEYATMADIAEARQHFETRVVEPDPTASPSRRKGGTVHAKERQSSKPAGSLSYALDKDRDLPVQTVQFTTEPEFRGRHVALLMAYDLREHFAATMLRSSPMTPTDDGKPLLRSLRRRGIMAPDA